MTKLIVCIKERENDAEMTLLLKKRFKTKILASRTMHDVDIGDPAFWDRYSAEIKYIANHVNGNPYNADKLDIRFNDPCFCTHTLNAVRDFTVTNVNGVEFDFWSEVKAMIFGFGYIPKEEKDFPWYVSIKLDCVNGTASELKLWEQNTSL